ncbi:MAG: MmgE/PrpD family protein [Chloroflexi bacterium]|nr:MmgE/PrpD family protein [Chloroflexota bacterium]
MRQSLTETLAEWLVQTRAAGFSEETLAIARDYTLDWLGSALAGHATEAGAMLREYAQLQPSGPCRVLGLSRGCGAETAAFVNGALSHIVEMDDIDRGSVVHPAAVIMPAALAVAEREAARGRDFLAAVVAGYEIAIRVGEAVGKAHYRYFHNTATCGVFGAAAAAGWLLGLNAEQFVWALGNAGTQAAGLWEFNREGAMSKHLHPGRAAANGVLAADLAALGFTAARRILEGERGFFAATAADAKPSRVLAGLGEAELKIKGVSIKPHASCRHTHSTIDAALRLRERAADLQNIDRVTVETYQAALALCNNPDPRTARAAKFSLQYCVASALRRGRVGLSDFSPQTIMDPNLRELMARVRVRVAPEFEARYPAAWPARVRVDWEDGRMLEETVEHPKGDPENPLTRSELEAKFRELTAFGGFGRETEAWLDWVNGLSLLSF